VSSEDILHSFQIVGGYRQADLGLRPAETTQQEAGMSEDTVF